MFRLLKGITQQEIANRVGYSQGLLANYERQYVGKKINYDLLDSVKEILEFPGDSDELLDIWNPIKYPIDLEKIT